MFEEKTYKELSELPKINFSDKEQINSLKPVDGRFCPEYKQFSEEMVEEEIISSEWDDDIRYHHYNKGECFCAGKAASCIKETYNQKRYCSLAFHKIDSEGNLVFRCGWDSRLITIKPINCQPNERSY